MVKNNIEYMREYYTKNKERYDKYLNDMVYCECCIKDVKKMSLKRHQQSNAHIKKSQRSQKEIDLLKQLKELKQNSNN
jgi:hypothetical protein